MLRYRIVALLGHKAQCSTCNVCVYSYSKACIVVVHLDAYDCSS